MGFITPDGKVAVDFRFDRVQPFSEGLAAVRIGDRWGFIDRGGHLGELPLNSRTGMLRRGASPSLVRQLDP